MENVIDIKQEYDKDNNSKKDGFVAILDDGSKIDISDTAWNTDDYITKEESGEIFNGCTFFSNEIIKKFNLR